jgi:sodium transport system permease protein
LRDEAKMNPAPVNAKVSWSPQWHQVRVLYFREMRAAFRERTIVLNSILIPVFLYPFLLWAALTGLTFVQGQTEGFVSRIEVPEWPKGHPGLRLKLERDENIQLTHPEQTSELQKGQVQGGTVDAVLRFVGTGAGPSASGAGLTAQILYNQAQERSVQAKNRLTDLLEGYREEWLRRELTRQGVTRAEWQQFTISSRNVASGREMGGFILGMVAPVIFVVMVAVGCFYPAVDATAGERERSTWETLMSTAASRVNIVVAKYLYVATMGGLAGLLNLLAVILTLKPIFAPLLAKAGRTISYTLPASAFPIALLAGILLAGFIAAGMMLFAVFARTFKEGQSMIMPFYMLILVPIVFLQVPGLHLTLGLAFVPVVNLTLMVRHGLSGGLSWAAAAVTVVVSLLVIALCLRLAALVLQSEDVVTGAYQGGVVKFLKQRGFTRRREEKKP